MTGSDENGNRGGRRRGTLNRRTVAAKIRSAIVDLAIEGDGAEAVIVRRLRELRDDDPATFAELVVRLETCNALPPHQTIQA